MRFNKLPDIILLNEMFEYDDSSGNILWKIRKANRLRIGDIVGSLKKEGNTTYRIVELDYVKYKTHRIIYKMHNPEWDEIDLVDHINHYEIADNRIENLRLATHQQNQFNKNSNLKGTSKYRGVSFMKANNKWKSSIMLDGESIYLGLHENEIDAAIAYNIKAIELFGEHANINLIIT